MATLITFIPFFSSSVNHLVPTVLANEVSWRYVECADNGGALALLIRYFWVTYPILSKAASLPPRSK